MKLPKVNDLGFFEIRLESIGGMGANSAGKMLAEVGVLTQGFTRFLWCCILKLWFRKERFSSKIFCKVFRI